MIYAHLFLNARSRQVQQEMGNPYELHRSLMSAFPDGDTREKAAMLYRIDQDITHDRGVIAILVQSSVQPDWQLLIRRPDYLLQSPVAQKQFDPPQNLQGTYRFMLRANPTLRKNNSRKLVPLQKEEQLIQWIQNKGRQNGFSVQEEGLFIRKMPAMEMYKSEQGKRLHIQIQAVDFSGLLTIHDYRLFLQAWQTGIGRGKAFGCGLLSIARA